MITHKKTKKRRIFMMRIQKLIDKEVSNENRIANNLNDTKGVHK